MYKRDARQESRDDVCIQPLPTSTPAFLASAATVLACFVTCDQHQYININEV
jgi:hypothetical protein